jgi:hypothetical protein
LRMPARFRRQLRWAVASDAGTKAAARGTSPSSPR